MMLSWHKKNLLPYAWDANLRFQIKLAERVTRNNDDIDADDDDDDDDKDGDDDVNSDDVVDDDDDENDNFDNDNVVKDKRDNYAM